MEKQEKDIIFITLFDLFNHLKRSWRDFYDKSSKKQVLTVV